MVVVGARIAGLSLVHALTNNAQDEHANNPGARTLLHVTIFSFYLSLEDADSDGIQINGSVGMLHRINLALLRQVTEVSTPLSKIQSRTTLWFLFCFVWWRQKNVIFVVVFLNAAGTGPVGLHLVGGR